LIELVVTPTSLAVFVVLPPVVAVVPPEAVVALDPVVAVDEGFELEHPAAIRAASVPVSTSAICLRFNS